MKKSFLYLLLLCASMQIHAVHLSSDGTGQVLIFPYYTVNGGFDTLINLTNITGQAKALRVRFREAANSREVYKFNLYLGPYDVWVGALIKGDEDDNYHTKLLSPDLSCTVPIIDNQNSLFFKHVFTGAMSDQYGDHVERLYEGFIEVIEMGVVTGDSAIAINTEGNQQDCQKLEDAWRFDSNSRYWFNDANVDMLPPSGGIMGNVVLINVQEGVAITQEASVIDNFTDKILHHSPGEFLPNLAGGQATSQVIVDGTLVEMQWSSGIDALSSLLMKESYSNDFVLLDSINATTDWIMTMPTRQFYTDGLYVNDLSVAPFTDVRCEVDVRSRIYNRNGLLAPEPIVDPVPPDYNNPYLHNLCYAINNLQFLHEDSFTENPFGMFSSNFPVNPNIGEPETLPDGEHINVPNDTGWAEFSFGQAMVSDNGFTVHGLPIIGFAAQKYVNGNFGNGVLANYAGLFNHKTNAKITSHETQQTIPPMSISSDGKGQVLLYPYYTVKNGINTLLSITNPTDEVKAVKVTFHEGVNSRGVMDFNLYLGPKDVWTAALIDVESTVPGHSGESSVQLITHDTSCTVPEINSHEFGLSSNLEDGLGNNIQRVQEGFIEVVEMGTVTGSDAISATTRSRDPASCPSIVSNWHPLVGQWAFDPTINMTPPDGTSKLYGTVSLIDVAGGVDMTYDAVAINNYSTELLHTEPGNLLPNLASGNQATTLIDTVDGVIQTTWGSPIDAVSALFMQSQINNDFVVTSSIGAQTEWVNLFPTKSFYTDPLYSGSSASLPPFSEVIFNEFGTCDKHRFIAYNREQEVNGFIPSGVVGSPMPPNFSDYPEDCWSVNVSDINMGTDMNSIFDSRLFINDLYNDNDFSSRRDLPFDSGWMKIDFIDSQIVVPEKLVGTGPNGETHEIYGKPVLGFVAQKFTNGNLSGGILANYAVINMNKGLRKIDVSTPAK